MRADAPSRAASSNRRPAPRSWLFGSTKRSVRKRAGPTSTAPANPTTSPATSATGTRARRTRCSRYGQPGRSGQSIGSSFACEDRGDRRDVGRDGRMDRGHPVARAGRPWRAIVSSSRSCGRACAVTPSRPTIVVAATRALTIASSVASIVASNSGSIARSADHPERDGRIATLGRWRGQPPVAGRQGEEQVARVVAAGAPHPCQAEAGALGETRRIGAAAAARRWRPG